jgi:uncharacterized membrane protein YagU involved in acid resistance
MSRAQTWTGVAVVWIVAFLVHYISIVLFSPDSALFEMGADNQLGEAGGQAWAMQIHDVMVLWLPLAMAGFSLVFALIVEYERQRFGVQT